MAVDAKTADFWFRFSGSVSVLFPETDAARTWIDENIGGEVQWMGRGVAIEWRYVDSILAGVALEGLTVFSL